MNKSLAIATLAGLLATPAAFGQGFGQAAAQPNTSFQNRLNAIVRRAEGESNEPTPSLTKFDLDFPGGTPQQLVTAIEKSSGKPLNAIVPTEFNDVEIPPLRMRAVNVAELFDALGKASQKTLLYATGVSDYGPGMPSNRVMQSFNSTYGFRTDGTPRDESVWYFYYSKLPKTPEPRICRFWQLAPYLDTYNVDDITTAVQTGYKMLGEEAPKINFHKDTKLLIAVGEANQLNLVDSVLKQLQPAPMLQPPPRPGSFPPPARKAEPTLQPNPPPPAATPAP